MSEFSKLNGYDVKDASARENIASLDTSIKNINFDNVKIAVPKSSGEVSSGDCMIIKAYDKVILIDTHYEGDGVKEKMETFFERNGVDHIDYVIITHYHPDHAGNLINFIDDGYIDVSTHVYLPAYSDLITDTAYTLYEEINAKLNEENIPKSTPNELDTLEINDFKITFYNCETSIFTEEEYESYNDCSTVCLMEYGNIKGLFTGDAERKTYERFNRLGYFDTKIDLYKVEHHGINYTPQHMPFINKIAPDYAILTAEWYDVTGGAATEGTTTSFLKNKGCKIYSVFDNDEDIVFEVSKHDISVKQGKETLSWSNRTAEVTLYVDSSTTNTERLGTSEAPFKSLSECFARLENSNNSIRYIIQLADGNYATNTSATGNSPKISSSVKVEIRGNTTNADNVKIYDSLQLYNGVYLTINSVSFVNTQAIYAENSSLRINSCKFTCESGSNITHIFSENCKVNIIGSTFTNGNIGISAHSDELFVLSTTFTGVTTAMQNTKNGRIHQRGNTFTNVTNRVSLYDGSLETGFTIPHAELLWSGEVTQVNTELTLNKALNNYNALIVKMGYNGNNATVFIAMADLDNFYSNYQIFGSYNYTSGGNATPGLLKLEIGSNLSKVTVTKQDGINVRNIFGVKIDKRNY